jgi:hypothetical protein
MNSVRVTPTLHIVFAAACLTVAAFDLRAGRTRALFALAGAGLCILLSPPLGFSGGCMWVHGPLEWLIVPSLVAALGLLPWMGPVWRALVPPRAKEQVQRGWVVVVRSVEHSRAGLGADAGLTVTIHNRGSGPLWVSAEDLRLPAPPIRSGSPRDAIVDDESCVDAEGVLLPPGDSQSVRGV